MSKRNLVFTLLYLLVNLFGTDASNMPVPEDLTHQLVQIMDDHCRKIPFDLEDVNRVLKLFKIDELLDETICDLVYATYNISKQTMAEKILESDTDIEKAVNEINGMFNLEILKVSQNRVTLSLENYNEITRKTAKSLLEEIKKVDKVAAYMLRNLIALRNDSNYEEIEQRILTLEIPVESVILELLPIYNSYHNFLREYQQRTDDENINIDKLLQELETNNTKSEDSKEFGSKNTTDSNEENCEKKRFSDLNRFEVVSNVSEDQIAEILTNGFPVFANFIKVSVRFMLDVFQSVVEGFVWPADNFLGGIINLPKNYLAGKLLSRIEDAKSFFETSFDRLMEEELKNETRGVVYKMFQYVLSKFKFNDVVFIFNEGFFNQTFSVKTGGPFETNSN